MDNYPRVTEVIGHFCGIPDVDMSRGSAVHKACELWDKNDLDESTVEDCVKPYLDSYKKFLRENTVEWEFIEHEVEHPIYLYRGRLDRVGYVNGKRMIVDLKSNSIPVWANLQLWAYSMALWEEEEKMEPLERRVLVLTAHGYKLSAPYTNTNDRQVFLSMLTVYNWKRLNLGK